MEAAAKVKHDKLVAEAKKARPYGAGKYILRTSNKHPTGKYFVLDIAIDKVFREYSLNEKQAKELSSVGARAWVEHGTAKHMEADKKMHKIMGDLKDLDKGDV